MVDYLTHYYRRGTTPFRSLSDLPEAEALALMAGMYVEGSVIWERFKDPQGYLRERRETEEWLYAQFVAHGGRPRQHHPIYMVLGSPRWVARMADPATLATTAEIRIPLSALTDADVSFTYPDSMVTRFVAQAKDPASYQPDYHGRLFTLPEILAIVAVKGLPDDGWDTGVPDTLAHYIEAQVWNRQPLLPYLPAS
ncbi:MAG: hypothetical protein U0768_20180 [Anaerolineae bacterium]